MIGVIVVVDRASVPVTDGVAIGVDDEIVAVGVMIVAGSVFGKLAPPATSCCDAGLWATRAL